MTLNCLNGLKFFLFLTLFTFIGWSVPDARQITLHENFEDQDLNQNPQWTGDLNDFTFFEDFGSNLLRLNAESSSNRSQIRTASATVYGSWEFYVQVPATSSQNRVYFYLISDDEELDIVGSGSPGVANGYAIHTGSGRFDLVKIVNGQQTEILLSSNTEIFPERGYQIKVTRDESGLWEIYVGEGYGSEAILDSEGTTDQSFSESHYFGIYVRYSQGNIAKYYFDSIIIKGLDEPDEDEDDSAGEEEGGEAGDGDDSDGEGEEGEAENGDDSDGEGEEDGGEDSNESEDAGDDENEGEEGGAGDGGDSDGEGEEDVGEDSSESEDAGDDENEGEDGGLGDDSEGGNGNDGDEGDGNDEKNDDESAGGSEDGEEDDNEEQDTEDDNGGSDDENQENSGESDEESEGDSEQSEDEQDSGDTESSDEDDGDNDDQGSEEDNGDSCNVGYETEEVGPIINPGDLLISEFYYRVPVHWRTAAFDRPQYVELYNRSGSQLNLCNLMISGENVSIDRDLIMDSGEYLVITRGLQVFEHRFGTRNFIEADQFPRFNLTTTGTITLENVLGETVDELTFSASEWGGNGVSLERLSFDLSANLRGNWGESMDALTGSPGLPNTVSIPNMPPLLESISVIAQGTLLVRFSRELDAEKSNDLSNYNLDQEMSFTSLEFQSGGSTLLFTTAENFQQFTEYKFTYQYIEDIFGNKEETQQELNFIYENPFKILSADLIDNQQLRIQFTLPVNLSKSDEAVFRLSNGLEPIGIQFINSETAILSFGTEFSTGSYELIVSHIESFDPDLPEQWVIEPNSTYQFFRFDDYSVGDIVINEFMIRPPDGYPRYVELYNRSGSFLNLKEWQVRRREGGTNNGGIITDLDHPLGAGEFVVITTDHQLMNAVFGPGPWIKMQGFPGFTQTTQDQIRLISPDGELHEMVVYEPSEWGGNGISLERRSLNAPASHPGNWSETEADLLGTPGLPNSVGPLQQAPEWVGVEIVDSKTIKVEIEGTLDEENLRPNQFSINGGLTVIQIIIEGSNQIELHLDSPMLSGQSYTLTIQGITDIFGNVMREQQQSVIYFHVETAQPGDVLINEFMYNEPDDYSRYIELYNRSDKIIDLAGWRQANNTGTRRILFEESTLFHPDEYVVITPNENLLFFFPDLSIINVGNRLSALKNGGDSIIIENSESIVIDSLTYTPLWGGAGIAMERKSADVSANHRENWAESTAELLGTPGESNTAVPDSDPPEAIQIKQFENRGFRILMSKQPEQSSVLNLNNYQIRPSVVISDIDIGEEEIVINIESELVNNQSYLVTISGITDIFGNVMVSTEMELRFLKLSDVSRDDVVINEILYRRKDAGGPQFVELINRTDKNFDLTGWTLSNSTGSERLPDDLFIPAMAYLVFTDSELLASKSDNIVQLSGFRSLNNRSDVVKISNQMGEMIDSLRYESSWQNNPPGVSLERRDPAALTVDPFNWMSSSDPTGSTPGELNSRFEPDEQPPELMFVNLFHPDSLEVVFNKFIDLTNSIEKAGFSKSTLSNSETEEVGEPIFYVNGDVVPILKYDKKREIESLSVREVQALKMRSYFPYLMSGITAEI